VKQVQEDIAFLLRHCAPSMGVCCATRGNQHREAGRNVPEELKCHLHVSESIGTRKVLADATGEKFRTNIYVTEDGDNN
jgi:hypothetical protein